MKKRWSEAKTKALDVLRADYQAQLEAFAEELRPRFQSGELRGFRDVDSDDGQNGGTSPMYTIDMEVERYFNLDESGSWQDVAMVFLGSACVDEVYPEDSWNTVSLATVAVAREVIRLARARGWYVPTEDEEPRDRTPRKPKLAEVQP